MSSTYGGTNTYPALITIPSDGDAPNAASVNTPFQGLADRTAYLYDKKTGWYHIPLGAPLLNVTSRWTAQSLGWWLQTDVTDAGELLWPIWVPANGKIDGFIVHVGGDLGGGGPHGAKPGTMPEYNLNTLRNDTFPGGTGNVYTKTDDSADAAAYDALHTMGVTSGINHTILTDRTYWLQIYGENGANKLPNALGVLAVRYKVIPV